MRAAGATARISAVCSLAMVKFIGPAFLATIRWSRARPLHVLTLSRPAVRTAPVTCNSPIVLTTGV